MRRAIKRRIIKKLKKVLIIITLASTVLVVAIQITTNNEPKAESVQIVSEEKIASSDYIINKETILKAINTDLQLVTYTQDFTDSHEYVDKAIFGERHTDLTYSGTYKLGMNKKEMVVKHIDEQNGIVYIQLPKPTIISVEIPYNKVEFEKVQGWARLAMNQEEKNNFYEASVKQFKKELMENKEIMKAVELLNKDGVSEFLASFGVKKVVFE